VTDGPGAYDAEDVFRRLGGPVHAYLRATGAADSEDLLGDVFCEVTRTLRRFHGDDEALRRWVFTIAHHRVIDEYRRATVRRRAYPARTLAAVPAPPEPLDPQIEAALAQLTPEQREVVVLRFVADLSLETVATTTGRSVGAVKAMQHRALAQLEGALGTAMTSTAVVG
jgi:RNA polymerase sigma-70 factor (ECF subfamily)